MDMELNSRESNSAESNYEESNSADSNYEELLDDKFFRLTMKPINSKFESLWKMYKQQVKCFWTPEEIDFSNDKYDFETLTKEEQHFIKMVLAFFAFSDGLVNLNLKERFLKEIKPTEAQTAYGFQLMMENIHSEVYADMLLNIIDDAEEKKILMKAFETVDSVRMISDWANKWIESNKSIGHRLIAFAIVEGVFFSGAFAGIFWLKKYRAKGEHFMNGLVQSNKFIARDEGLHTTFACLLYSFILNRVDKEEVYVMMKEAVNISINFTCDTIRCDMIGMNIDLMTKYLQYVSDRLLVDLGYEKLFFSENPFEFMDSIGFIGKANFFEQRPTEYQKAAHEENTGSWKFKILDKF